MDGSGAPVVWADGESNSEVINERETLSVKELAKTTAGESTGKGQKRSLNQEGPRNYWELEVRVGGARGGAEWMDLSEASFQGQQRPLMA